MLRFEWNALRVGDLVLVHDDAMPGLTLDEGVVVLVQPAAGVNDVAVRVSRSGAEPIVVRPKRLAVHLRPLDETSECWRCAQLEVAAAATG